MNIRVTCHLLTSVLALLAFTLSLSACKQAEQESILTEPAAPERPEDHLEAWMLEEWKGDLDGIVERGMLRLLVPYSLSYYFHDGAKRRGPLAEAGTKFEQFLNSQFKGKKRPIDIVYIPVNREDLLKGLIEGRGDLAAGGITITAERQKSVAFSEATMSGVSEIIVTTIGKEEFW